MRENFRGTYLPMYLFLNLKKSWHQISTLNENNCKTICRKLNIHISFIIIRKFDCLSSTHMYVLIWIYWKLCRRYKKRWSTYWTLKQISNPSWLGPYNFFRFLPISIRSQSIAILIRGTLYTVFSSHPDPSSRTCMFSQG